MAATGARATAPPPKRHGAADRADGPDVGWAGRARPALTAGRPPPPAGRDGS
jgi:hypothetical protein